MSEKLTASITFKCTDEEKAKLEKIASSEKISTSELMRTLGIERISKAKTFLNSLCEVFGLTTDTVDTRKIIDVIPIFDLEASPNPVPQIQQTQKKPSCRNQLSIFVSSTNKSQ